MQTGLRLLLYLYLTKNNRELIGYLRASQSLEEVDEIITRLDLGLAVGAIVAVVLSSVG